MPKLLILAANPTNTSRLRLEEELRDIDEGLRRAQHRDRFTLAQRLAVRPRDIQRAMLDETPQIVHFSGHGQGPEGLVFEDETGQAKLVSGKALANLFALFADPAEFPDPIQCVVLNGCYSQVQAEAIAEHVPYVIGMTQAIGDRAAIDFAVGFYDALGAGRNVEFAFKLGCVAIDLAGKPESATPILMKLKSSGWAETKLMPHNFIHSVIRTNTSSNLEQLKLFQWSSIAEIVGNLEEGVDHSLIGRKKELCWLFHCLGKKDIRLITIHGRGGTGKTKLLQTVSALIKTARDKNLTTQSFPEVIFIDLSRALNASNILQSLMAQVPESRRQEIQKSILDNQELSPYQKATSFFAEIENRNLVVVLDKFENAVNPSDQSLFEKDLFEIIKLCLEHEKLSSLKLVLASRFPAGSIQQIRPDRQELYQLRGLSSPDAVKLILSLDNSGSARLKNESKSLLAELCYQLEGNPSAIERLIGYLRRFPSVSASSFLAGNRQSNFNTLVEKLIDFEALENDFQRVIQTLSVFQIPCSIDLICYVLNPFIQKDNIKNILSKLVDLYLVSEQDGLYQVDVITRNNSLSALEWGNREDAYCSPPIFTRFCLLHRVAYCINQYREYNSFDDSLMDVELAIIEFDRWLEGEDFDSSAEVLVNCVNSCLHKLGYYDLAIDLHNKLIEHPIKTSFRILISNNIGCLYLALEKISDALKWFEESECIADNSLSRAHAIGNKGLCYDRIGNPRKAIQQYNCAISEIKKLKDSKEHSLPLDERRRLVALWLSNIGICYEHLGVYQKAIKYHNESIRISKASKVVESQVQGLGNLGDVYGALGEFSLAEENYQDALDIIHDCSGSQYDKGIILASWAEILADQGYYERSISMASEAVFLGKEISSPSLESLANSAISRAYLHYKQTNLAFEFIQDACKADFYLNKSYSFLLRGIIELKCGQPARTSLRSTLRYSSELLRINSSRYEILAYQGLAFCGLTLCDKRNRIPKAFKAFNDAFKGKTLRGFAHRVLNLLDEIIDEDKDYILSNLRADLVKITS